MSLKKRIDMLSEKVHASSRPKRGIVCMANDESEIKKIEKEFASLPADTPCAIVIAKDMSIDRPGKK